MERFSDELLQQAREKIIFALDTSDLTKAALLLKAVSPHVGMVKIGPEFMHTISRVFFDPTMHLGEATKDFLAARELVQSLRGRIFLDEKFRAFCLFLNFVMA